MRQDEVKDEMRKFERACGGLLSVKQFLKKRKPGAFLLEISSYIFQGLRHLDFSKARLAHLCFSFQSRSYLFSPPLPFLRTLNRAFIYKFSLSLILFL